MESREGLATRWAGPPDSEMDGYTEDEYSEYFSLLKLLEERDKQIVDWCLTKGDKYVELVEALAPWRVKEIARIERPGTGAVNWQGIADMLGVPVEKVRSLRLASIEAIDRREAFRAKLAEAIQAREPTLKFCSATFGRLVGGIPVWTVLLQGVDGLRSRIIKLPAGTEPYSDATCERLVAGVVP